MDDIPSNQTATGIRKINLDAAKREILAEQETLLRQDEAEQARKLALEELRREGVLIHPYYSEETPDESDESSLFAKMGCCALLAFIITTAILLLCKCRHDSHGESQNGQSQSEPGNNTLAPEVTKPGTGLQFENGIIPQLGVGNLISRIGLQLPIARFSHRIPLWEERLPEPLLDIVSLTCPPLEGQPEKEFHNSSNESVNHAALYTGSKQAQPSSEEAAR